MTSNLFPSPHSCGYCKNLTLDRRDVEWWEKAIKSISEDSEDFVLRLSDRAKQWLYTQVKGELWTREQFDTSKILDFLKVFTKRDSQNMVIFNFTIGEAKEGSLC
jgi:hypothetical protein